MMLSLSNEDVQTLTDLGLTPWQAKVYLALVRLGTAKIKTISKLSGVPRQHIYQLISTLFELGLIKKVINYPATFEAIPLRDGLSILMEDRLKETCELQAKTKELVQKFKGNARTKLQEEGTRFILIPDKQAALKMRGKLIENTQTSLDVIDSWKRFRRTYSTYSAVFTKMMKRGVKTRAIMDTPKDKKSIALLKRVTKDFNKNYSHKTKYLLRPPSAIMAIHDQKEALITINPTTDLAESACLWLNNSSLLTVLQDYFDLMWLTSLEEIPKKHSVTF